jgi:hypothetical protein
MLRLADCSIDAAALSGDRGPPSPSVKPVRSMEFSHLLCSSAPRRANSAFRRSLVDLRASLCLHLRAYLDCRSSSARRSCSESLPLPLPLLPAPTCDSRSTTPKVNADARGEPSGVPRAEEGFLTLPESMREVTRLKSGVARWRRGVDSRGADSRGVDSPLKLWEAAAVDLASLSWLCVCM